MNKDSAALQRQVAELESQMQAQSAQLADAHRELEDLAHFISHDLRAPLRGIDGYSKILLEEYASSLDEMARAYLQYINDASLQAIMLIERLLYYSRALRSALQPEAIDLSALAEEISANLRRSQPDRWVDIAITPGLHATADRKMIRTVLENLLDNAWKFTSRHPSAQIEFGVTQDLPASIAVKQPAAPSTPVFYVRDDGAGFNMAYQSKLFIPFQRLHSAHEFEGIGIGLATARRIVRRHGGDMWAEGAIDQGATFYFTLSG
jgi:light-regulated signal transduction histidine kinase (bacteriophytochrome)